MDILFAAKYEAKYHGKHFHVKQFFKADILHARQSININENFKQHKGLA